jgi:hypothetical protein
VWPEGILFYQGVMLAALVSAAHGVWSWRRRTASTPFKDAALTLLLAYSFMFTVPTTIDRAYSVRMLQLLASSPEGLSRARLTEHFTERFIRHGGLDRRIAEQLSTGSIEVEGDQIRLTERGRHLATWFDWGCRWFSCQAS